MRRPVVPRLRPARRYFLLVAMPHYVALLRGINLGKRRVKMDHLRELFEQLKLTNVRTFLASGNVLFSSPSRSASKLRNRIEQHLETALGYPVPTLIRTWDEIHTVVQNAPLSDLFSDGPHPHTQVTFFPEPLDPATTARLVSTRTDTDAFAVIGRELYWRCATRMSDSPVWKNSQTNPHNLPEATTRNLNTLQKLVAQYPPP